ncbi:MAG: hypothetical protein AAB066_04300 [Candidatus Margulisiibacteriota bacterium]
MQISNFGALGNVQRSDLSQVIKELQDQISGIAGMPGVVLEAFDILTSGNLESRDISTVGNAIGTLDFFAKSERADRSKPAGRNSIERELIERIKNMLKDGIDDTGELMDILALLTVLGGDAPPILIKDFQRHLQTFIADHRDDEDVMELISNLANLSQFAGVDTVLAVIDEDMADGVLVGVSDLKAGAAGQNGLNLKKLADDMIKMNGLLTERLQGMLVEAATMDTGLLSNALDPIANIAAGRRGLRKS